ncbi:MAG: inosamine-phosphate amidinotransferase 1 [Kiritimatiellia bacterium]|jgi:N-dimethylarginine dimethylaminohydrolase|nr:inosamine-phosphate amidinotransferase 1 [Kiritimatiellia bacterium]MDP6848069.1 inosamine-phosphate amidinotransferase 1 [Kiritimatiellia bacterium]
MKINTHAEWHPLKEVVVGTATGAQVPTIRDESLHAVCYGDISDSDFAGIKTGPFPGKIIDEANEDLNKFADDLAALGIKVHRLAEMDYTRIYETADWAVDGQYGYCPRDSVLTVGNEAIATPMVLRHRQNEARMFDGLFDMVEAPLPRLLDSMYDRSELGKPTLMNHEPAFDAANCLKIGSDILYLVSNTGNHAGADWLQEHLGPGYRVHRVEDVYVFIHVDSTFTVLRPGLVLLCPTRVNENNLPGLFKGWDRIYAVEPDPMQIAEGWGGASKWIAMNLLSIGPDLVAIEDNQVNLMRQLEKYGIDSMPVRLRHTRTLGGGPHCVTLDLVREGVLEDYSC